MKLEIKNLSFSYKNKEILNNISFEVYSGTLLSILGANGAGKTTLIKCINGILNFKKGEVLIDEKNFNNKSLKEKSKIMSYVPQITSSFDIDLTVFDTVLLGRVPHKTFKFSEWDKQIALNNIKKLDLEKYLFSYVGDTGLTGRKIIVDTYGGYFRHGGGAFSGKDPSKVDRSAAYAARWVAKNIVAAELADKCEIQLSYAIGVPYPVSIKVDTFGTSKVDEDKISEAVSKVFDLSPKGIEKALELREGKFKYQDLAAFGHIGRTDIDTPWERINKVDELKKAINLQK